jgi:lipopolysaccharide/colanic/teichoic acid biosynthesis glycosyltransferase
MFITKIAAIFLLLIFLPLISIISIIIFLHDLKHPIYISERIGLNFKSFKFYKFRSMKIDSKIKFSTTSNNDPRLFLFGKFIRRLKLDEIPQLINIIKGDINFFGPRPNVKSEIDKYTDIEKEILNVKPGLFDFSPIVFSDESELCTNEHDPDLYFNLTIRPWKSCLGLFFIKNKSFYLNLLIFLSFILNFLARHWALKLITFSLKYYECKNIDLIEVCKRQSKLKIINIRNFSFQI